MFSISKKQGLLGLDISSTAVKLLELSQSRGSYRVEAYSVEPLPPSAAQEKAILDIEAVGEAVKRAVAKAGTRTRHVAVAVPGTMAVTRIISLPASLSEEEMEDQVRTEADQYIPYPLEEVDLDFEVIGPTQANPSNVDVIIAATRAENVEARVSVAQMANLQVKVVDIESFTIENAYNALIAPNLSSAERSLAVAVVDMGATMTSISVMHNARLVYTREHNFGGKHLTEDIMRRYEMSYEEAGRAKRLGGLPEDYVPRVLNPFMESAAQQLNRFLQFYFSSPNSAPLGLILLGGGTANIPGLTERIAEEVGIPTRIANPFANVTRSGRVPGDALSNDGTAMLIASGLALRSFD
ncbi:MAG: pilus assembly protein PilM [Halothiobacillaceae bacterium]|nr:pilus assembly protein PilM [Halothiobacillaceae bacterium]MDY0050218.1 pilus assembly protein PilM [Halothiobacillaceae bacterium]